MSHARPAACRSCGLVFGPEVEHEGRGLCRPCWHAHDRMGTLLSWARVTRPRDEVLQDYRARRRADPSATLHQHAVALGMTRAALEKAIARARAKGVRI